MDQRKQNKTAKAGQSSNKNQPMSKSAKRRARKTNANAPYSSNSMYPHIQAPGVSSKNIVSSQYKAATRSLTSVRVSKDGLSFLKCAFAPPDFASNDVKGVPDNFGGNSLVKKHRLVRAHNFTTASTDTYVLLLPTPGYAYWTATVTAGTSVLFNTDFTGVPYSDFSSMFNPSGTAGASMADVVNKFRYVSNHIEIVPTTNSMNWSGSVQAFKFPIAMVIRQNNYVTAGATQNLMSVTGLQSVNATNANQYTGPFNLGAYVGAFNTGSQFEFQEIKEFIVQLPSVAYENMGDFGRLVTTGGFTGIDNNFDAVCIKFSGMGTNVLNSCLIKTWSCVEYQVLTGSSLYEYQSVSPNDPVAIALYRKVVNELPIGVAFTDNDNFWQRVLGIIRRISGAASVLPGPYGLASSGVHSLATAVEQLAF